MFIVRFLTVCQNIVVSHRHNCFVGFSCYNIFYKWLSGKQLWKFRRLSRRGMSSVELSRSETCKEMDLTCNLSSLPIRNCSSAPNECCLQSRCPTSSARKSNLVNGRWRIPASARGWLWTFELDVDVFWFASSWWFLKSVALQWSPSSTMKSFHRQHSPSSENERVASRLLSPFSSSARQRWQRAVEIWKSIRLQNNIRFPPANGRRRLSILTNY